MGLIENYSKIVANKPWIVLIVSLIFTGIMFYGVSTMKMTGMDYEDILPQGIEVIDSMKVVQNEFGGTESAIIVIELNPSVANSNEPKDVRDPRIISYVDVLSQKIRYASYVKEISSVSESVKKINNGYLPSSLSESKNLLGSSASNLISSDYTMTLIRIRLNEDASSHSDEIEKELSEIIDETEKPAGISVQLAGETMTGPIMKRMIQPDMSKTSIISFAGIIIVLLFLFHSLKNGLLPLTTILFGTVWAMGFTSLIGMGISPATSGVISMIMGIGIDFGIQIIARFKQELRTHDKRKAMEITLNGIFVPMLTTTLAALVGFSAMSLGKLKLMGEMGTMMSLGVAFCMLAAITIVPSILVIFEKDKNSKKFKYD